MNSYIHQLSKWKGERAIKLTGSALAEVPASLRRFRVLFLLPCGGVVADNVGYDRLVTNYKDKVEDFVRMYPEHRSDRAEKEYSTHTQTRWVERCREFAERLQKGEEITTSEEVSALKGHSAESAATIKSAKVDSAPTQSENKISKTQTHTNAHTISKAASTIHAH